ncbi:MAG: VanW family protein [Patescibacteria group bacterium]|jgi:vancomycin resistance protein YoaR
MAILTTIGRKLALLTAALFIALTAVVILYRVAYAGHVLPNVSVGNVDVGGLSATVAEAKVSARLRALHDVGIPLKFDSETQVIHLQQFGLNIDGSAAVKQAMSVGRRGDILHRINESSKNFFVGTRLAAPLSIDEVALTSEIADIATLYDEPGRDIRLSINGTNVNVLKDTKPGLIIDQQKLRNDLLASAAELEFQPLVVEKISTQPSIDPGTVADAVNAVKRVIGKPLVLVYQGNRYTVTREELGSFVASASEGNKLTVHFDTVALSKFVADLADKMNTTAKNLQVVVNENQVVSFSAPQPGRTLQEEDTILLLTQALQVRLQGQEEVSELSLPVSVREPVIDGSAADLGIRELIGTATTSFSGSPKNRIANIKNGTRFLSGLLVKPGEEFSTLQSLGSIDNTTGYLPELVIKGDRTVPEFGGGLCQVSTTLFRSLLNAGLPITARQNHSYRVSYYEKDGNGVRIGPGLDATIYSPRPDLRFRNDTANSLLIVGRVEGLLITFDLYGTKDGRQSVVDGPHTLSSIPSGDPIYVESDTIGANEKKLLEHAHPGGSAIAKYTVTYGDGHVINQEFKSYYRPWPERWLVGSDTLEAKKMNSAITSVTNEAAPVVVE